MGQTEFGVTSGVMKPQLSNVLSVGMSSSGALTLSSAVIQCHGERWTVESRGKGEWKTTASAAGVETWDVRILGTANLTATHSIMLTESAVIGQTKSSLRDGHVGNTSIRI